MGTRTGYVDTEEPRVSEVTIYAGCAIDKVVLLHQLSHGSAVHPFARSTRAKGCGAADHSIHNVESVYIFMGPRYGLECKSYASYRSFGPRSVLPTNIL